MYWLASMPPRSSSQLAQSGKKVSPEAAAALIAANDPILSAPAATSGLDEVDFWVGGLAEKPAVFGGLLGSTFNFVFEHQLEHLQDGDRFYYLQRTDGLNMRFSLEGNSLTEMARRNTSLGGTMDNIFNFADFTFDPTSTAGVLDPTTGIALLAQADGTIQFFDPLHTACYECTMNDIDRRLVNERMSCAMLARAYGHTYRRVFLRLGTRPGMLEFSRSRRGGPW